MNRVLITGATGEIGKRLIEKFNFTDTHIIALGRTFDKFDYSKKNVIPLVCDLNSDLSQAISRQISNTETLIHLASNVSDLQTNYVHFDEINSTNVLSLVKLLPKLNRLKRVIFISSTSVYDFQKYSNLCDYKLQETDTEKPAGLYSITKLISEKILNLYCKDNKIDLCTLRVSSVFSPPGYVKYSERAVNIFSDKIKKGDPITIVGSGDCPRNYIYIDDVVNSILWSYENDINGLYNLCAPYHVTLNNIVSNLTSIIGKKVTINYVQGKSNPHLVSNRKFMSQGFTDFTNIKDALKCIV